VAIEDYANYVATTNNLVTDHAKAVAEESTVDNIVAQTKTTK